ncbi:3-oxoacyl-ACP reductase FabG [Bosea caraganae]|uniref:3-oxoacyl-ACP reductase FabG n=1 Tax=Bosea caraganae TaxID=2763117 RepID=A0A370L6W0_9HYPH|nr:3-oxoacyl-ACP reductase family protein [Bosea caraganae]RDJ25497.1 3-oxoacyl-ACP reductase FabG [Bosea caraganae]RDJ25716.1 3-oxoacyl-ACP reductase FabG [Bosea caraganae]
MARLAGLTALVTGGGRGIGAATARRFAQEGARVAIMGKGETSLAEMKARSATEGLTMETVLGDVTSSDDVKRAIGEVAARFGRIDILVNNAGASHPRPFEERTAEEMLQTLNTNLVSVFLCCQAVAPHMLAQGSGRIINVTSVRGLDQCGREGVMDYSAAKAGVVNLTKTLAKQLAPAITVNAVAPGHTNTDILRALPQEVRDRMLAGTYLQRFAEPEDIAAAILFMASPEASFITGQHLVVDGGFSLKAG